MKIRGILTAGALVIGLSLTGCGVPTVTQIDTKALQQVNMQDSNIQVIDVRTPEEYKTGHIPDAKLIPVQELPQRLSEIDKTKQIYLICRSGSRSQQAADILSKNGFKNVYNVTGGMQQWQGPVAK